MKGWSYQEQCVKVHNQHMHSVTKVFEDIPSAVQ